MKDWIRMTKLLASNSSYYRAGRRTGCLIIKGNKLLSSGFNKMKNRIGVKRKTVHAEIDSLNKKNGKDLQGSVAYIFRQNGGISKPCSDCSLALIRAGIKRMIYENRDGKIEKWP